MQPDNKASGISHHTLRISGIVAVIVAAVIVVTGVTTRANNNTSLKAWTDKQAVPTVSVGLPGGADDGSSLDLPGRFEAYARAPIYARVSGYLKSWKADIGTKVTTGQLLAEIETPDLDQQLLQARADLASTQANVGLAATTAKRWQEMLVTDSVSKQEVDDKSGDYASKQAMVKASQANVDRLLALKGFARIVSPFNGTVTARNTDTGALINAGGGSGPALFEISDTRKLRLYVNVPQNYVASIKQGTKAKITVPEHQDKTYTATVESTSGSIDVASGTTLVQLAVNNAGGELLPGGFANVSLDLPTNKTVLSVPASALIFDQSGLRVATVGADNKVTVKTITIARDLGKQIEIHSGIEATDRVVENPPDGIADGDQVNVADNSNKSDKK
ncbi:efflux RND transporter periplasmic adaptor subunit [Methylotenera versatilis]|uniref:Efflux transporter, RND family, MFP subunit n=1 Tax=Methylotenera versatilis (strain 301) TaxID=666681 RepID=D7DPH3_METV0|nr:efflux RND transporter periplasmic adaptor subunit [Methylotenera versatilis]ADI29217.1 efflux transporter, RND family, MFP subunit [Methylotenera versatilis 301]